jgi:hypothetical protein
MGILTSPTSNPSIDHSVSTLADDDIPVARGLTHFHGFNFDNSLSDIVFLQIMECTILTATELCAICDVLMDRGGENDGELAYFITNYSTTGAALDDDDIPVARGLTHFHGLNFHNSLSDIVFLQIMKCTILTATELCAICDVFMDRGDENDGEVAYYITNYSTTGAALDDSEL